MLYRPEKGAMWDPTLWYEPKNNKFYMLSMHYKDERDGGTGMWLAESEDGVHFKGVGQVLSCEGDLFKMFINSTADGRYCVNFGSTHTEDDPTADNDTMRYAVSSDLVNWEVVCRNHPDGRWYQESGRWDHMYALYNNEEKMYYGAIVATPKHGESGCFGLQSSPDGIHWTTLPPPVIEWGDIPPINCLEGGGLEKIGDKYYYIGGFVGYAGNYGYNLYTFVADQVTGPYRPDKEAFRLCGFDRFNRVFIENLAAFCRVGDDVLVSNAVMAGGRDDVWLIPLRRAKVDENGHLRLWWWEGNEALKGETLPVSWALCSVNATPDVLNEGEAGVWTPAAFEADETTLHIRPKAPIVPTISDVTAMATLTDALDPTEGLVLEGTMICTSAPAYIKEERKTHCWRPARVGFWVEDGDCEGRAITLDIGHPYKRRSNVMEMKWNDTGCDLTIIDENGEGSSCVRGISAEEKHTFRFLWRLNVLQLYVDDQFVQTFVVDRAPTGRVGVVAQNADVRLEKVKAWKMSITDPAHSPVWDKN
ncbi:MAG: hypothetical protein IKU90_00120 [Clostridia bacterium]|nr:hypothetical protein [Clostridia bacterium]